MTISLMGDCRAVLLAKGQGAVTQYEIGISSWRAAVRGL